MSTDWIAAATDDLDKIVDTALGDDDDQPSATTGAARHNETPINGASAAQPTLCSSAGPATAAGVFGSHEDLSVLQQHMSGSAFTAFLNATPSRRTPQIGDGWSDAAAVVAARRTPEQMAAAASAAFGIPAPLNPGDLHAAAASTTTALLSAGGSPARDLTAGRSGLNAAAATPSHDAGPTSDPMANLHSWLRQQGSGHATPLNGLGASTTANAATPATVPGASPPPRLAFVSPQKVGGVTTGSPLNVYGGNPVGFTGAAPPEMVGPGPFGPAGTDVAPFAPGALFTAHARGRVSPADALVGASPSLVQYGSSMTTASAFQHPSHLSGALSSQTTTGAYPSAAASPFAGAGMAQMSPLHPFSGPHPPTPSRALGAAELGYGPGWSGDRVDSVRGHVYETAKDQYGCRQLQRLLDLGPNTPEGREAAAVIMEEIVPHAAELMTDQYANFLVQKLFDIMPQDVRYRVACVAAPSMTEIALTAHGTFSVQKLIETIATREEMLVVQQALTPHVVQLVMDVHGNHVIQKVLQRFDCPDKQFIYDAVCTDCIGISTNKQGCCVLQRCLEFASPEQRSTVIRHVVDCAVALVSDPFGNYVVQYIFHSYGGTPDADAMALQFLPPIVQLCRNKFSSNVVEKVLQKASPAVVDRYLATLARPDIASALLNDDFGNYVIQRALTIATPAQLDALVATLRPLMDSVRSAPYAKKVEAKLEQCVRRRGMSGHHDSYARGGMVRGSAGSTPQHPHHNSDYGGGYHQAPHGGYQGPGMSPNAPGSFGPRGGPGYGGMHRDHGPHTVPHQHQQQPYGPPGGAFGVGPTAYPPSPHMAGGFGPTFGPGRNPGATPMQSGAFRSPAGFGGGGYNGGYSGTPLNGQYHAARDSEIGMHPDSMPPYFEPGYGGNGPAYGPGPMHHQAPPHSHRVMSDFVPFAPEDVTPLAAPPTPTPNPGGAPQTPTNVAQSGGATPAPAAGSGKRPSVVAAAVPGTPTNRGKAACGSSAVGAAAAGTASGSASAVTSPQAKSGGSSSGKRGSRGGRHR